MVQHFNDGIQFRRFVIAEMSGIELQKKFFTQAQKPAKKKRPLKDDNLQIPFILLTGKSPMLHSFNLCQRLLQTANGDGVPASGALPTEPIN
jgi:hypothetical protein